MDNKLFNLPITTVKYKIRKTNEEVEVIDFEAKERGTRSDEDWVTYIDSKGEEHLKEHLNLMLDFKPSDSLNNIFDKMFDNDWKKNMPSTNNSRIYDMSKELIVHCNYTISEAVDTSLNLVKQIDDLKV